MLMSLVSGLAARGRSLWRGISGRSAADLAEGARERYTRRDNYRGGP